MFIFMTIVCMAGNFHQLGGTTVTPKTLSFIVKIWSASYTKILFNSSATAFVFSNRGTACSHRTKSITLRNLPTVQQCLNATDSCSKLRHITCL
jgi:hypothetical protein